MPPPAAAAAAAAAAALLAVCLLAASCTACPQPLFRCRNGHCVQQDVLCDTRVDCQDGSDEEAALCANRTCSDQQVACRRPGHCVSLQRRCDGFSDCSRSNASDLTDEAGCFGDKQKAACPAHQFTCSSDGKCIPDEYVCDNLQDCSDGSDEAACIRECDSSQYRCHDGKCIGKRQRCDGRVDCARADDELGCPISDKHRCRFATEFYCRLSDECVASTFLCDGSSDCTHGEDEVCPVQAAQCRRQRYWTCKSGQHCVPKSLRCDGRPHCPDASDELDCPLRTPQPRPCPQGRHHCNGTFDHCVEVASVCLGRQSCPLPDAEVDAACRQLREDQNPCASGNGGCEQNCRTEVAAGGGLRAVCRCRTGFRVSDKDASRCSDENECLRFGACSQSCANTHGSYSCSCRQGYSLHGNSCRANEPPTLLLSTSGGVELLAAGQRRAARDGLNFPTFLTPDTARRQLYFYSRDGSIARVAFNGSDLRLLAKNLLVDGLALDWTRRLLFFSSPRLHAASGTVGVLNVTSGRRVTLLQLPCPRGLAVHPQRGLLFVAETCGSRPGLYSFRLDGSGGRRLTTVAGVPLQLAVDTEQRPERLYWTDAEQKAILSCRLDGQDPRVHWRQPAGAGQHGAPHSLAVFEDKIYWTDPAASSLRSVSKLAASGSLRLEDGDVYGLLDVAVSQPLLQPPTEAPGCHCGHVCVAIDNQEAPACLCDERHELRNDTGACEPKPSPTQFVPHPPQLAVQDSSRRLPVGVVAASVAAGLGACVLLLALAACVWRRHRLAAAAPAHFVNESYSCFAKAPPYRRMAADEVPAIDECYLDPDSCQR